MLIGELSARTGVSPRLLRYYKSEACSKPPAGETDTDDRGDVVTTVRQIRRLLDMGPTTSMIKQVLRCASGELPELDLCPDLVQTIQRELQALDDRIDTLRHNRDALAGYLPGA